MNFSEHHFGPWPYSPNVPKSDYIMINALMLWMLSVQCLHGWKPFIKA
jgi:hypothetical protein